MGKLQSLCHLYCVAIGEKNLSESTSEKLVDVHQLLVSVSE